MRSSGTVTTIPGDDVTHPVPDNTGYITEDQFYLHGSVIDPFGSLSRLKQHVVGKATREDHSQIMNTMIRFYSEAVEAQRKQAISSDPILIIARPSGSSLLRSLSCGRH